MIALENENIQFFIPDEETPLWMDNFSIASDSTNVSGAHQFVDYAKKRFGCKERKFYLVERLIQVLCL